VERALDPLNPEEIEQGKRTYRSAMILPAGWKTRPPLKNVFVGSPRGGMSILAHDVVTRPKKTEIFEEDLWETRVILLTLPSGFSG